VADGKIYDNHCKEFVMRGVNDPYVWYAADAQKRYADIASIGANVVRVVLADGGQWTKVSGSAVKNIISWTKANKLVAVLEVHDATGYGDEAKAENPSKTLDYWLSSEIKSALEGTEAYVIINIANEAFGNKSSGEWEKFYTGAVPKLRQGGIKHLLMVDAPNWGQDWENTMRDGKGALNIFNADPQKNTVFSVHMYDVYPMADLVWDYFTRFLEKGVPLVVGEFGGDHGPGKPIDEAAIMDYATELQIGYMGWSWGGNSPELNVLDIVKNFDPKSLSPWGETLVNGPYGIKKTSKICSCFQ
jgi:mannan endo-1,4-beta-mannosidase